MRKEQIDKAMPKFTRNKLVRLSVFILLTAIGFGLAHFFPDMAGFGWGYFFGLVGMAILTA